MSPDSTCWMLGGYIWLFWAFWYIFVVFAIVAIVCIFLKISATRSNNQVRSHIHFDFIPILQINCNICFNFMFLYLVVCTLEAIFEGDHSAESDHVNILPQLDLERSL